MMQIILVLGFRSLVTRTSGGFHRNISARSYCMCDRNIRLDCLQLAPSLRNEPFHTKELCRILTTRKLEQKFAL